MKAIIIHSEITIREAMKALNKTGEKCLIVVDDNNKYIGTLTDGDLRRAILSGADFNDKIENSGARRLHTVMTSLLEDILFQLPDKKITQVKLDKTTVQEKLSNISEDEDLRRYIL
mgnify:CR=1 FL=1